MNTASKMLGIFTILIILSGCGGGSNIANDSESGGGSINPNNNEQNNNNQNDNEQQENAPAPEQPAPEQPAPEQPAPEQPAPEAPPAYPPVGGPGNTDGRTADNDNTPAITTIYIQEQSGNPAGSTNAPITFAQVFKKGDIPAGQSIKATLANDIALPIQVDKKATYDDGSIKHAVISAFIPELNQEEKARIYLNATNAAGDDTPLNLNTLLANGFDSVITITLDGTVYNASAADLLANTPETLWLSGQTVSEWIISAPIEDLNGNEHPHLQARFNIRAYSGFDSVRVSAIVENAWSYEPNPETYSYDLKITVGGETVLEQASVSHYHHSRFRRLFWWGTEPRISVNYKTSYLKDIKIMPNYDPSVYMTETALEDMLDDWEEKDDLMNVGTIKPDMPGTGSREDYGVLPGWTANYLISQDDRAKTVMLGNAEQAGTFSIHFRDKNTDLPLSIDDYPYCGFYGADGDKFNPNLQRSEVFPLCTNCAYNPNYGVRPKNTITTADMAHQPSLAFIPYALTGDYYFMEEQLFWAAYNFFQANPSYREYDKGILSWASTRAQAWGIRTLGQTAFIIPDDHPMKGYFKGKLDNNRDWYQANYVDDTEGYKYANDLGWVGYAWNQTYDGTHYGAISAWMSDFFTASVGHVLDLGYSNWNSVMQWQGQFPVGRLYGTDYCSTMAAVYQSGVGFDRYGPFFDWKDYYEATASIAVGSGILNHGCGSQDMIDWLNANTGYTFVIGELFENNKGAVANYMTRMQGAVAYAVDYGVPNADEAWSVYSGREGKTDFTDNPRYAIVPRN